LKPAETKYYPTFWQGANLVVLYIFIQTVIDFPLALYDYQKGTDLLYAPWIKVPVFIISTLAILYLGYRFSGLDFRSVFPIKKFNLLVIFGMILIFEGLQFFLFDVNVLLEKILPPPSWFMELFSRLFESDLGLWGGILRVALVAPIVEESIFRGVILSGFLKNYRPGWAVFYAALLFALFHLNPWQFPSAFLLGIILGWIRIRTGSLLACMTGHAVHNTLVFLSVHYYLQLKDINLLQPGVGWNYFFQGMVLFGGILLIWFLTNQTSEKPSSRKV
jgi:membrane protease YdiL (CAAX protease family)